MENNVKQLDSSSIQLFYIICIELEYSKLHD